MSKVNGRDGEMEGSRGQGVKEGGRQESRDGGREER